MSLGEHIVLSGTTLTNANKSDRVFNITSVGDNNYESELYVINISKSEFTTSQITIMDSIGVVEFTEDDIVRDPFLIKIMKKYKE